MGIRGLARSLTIIALGGGFTSFSHAQTELARTECDRLISALEGMGPAEAYEALQEMRIYRQGKRYTACVDAARALQVRSTLDERLSVAQLAEMDVFNEKDEQVGDVDRLAQGQDQRIYVLMTYRGPRWPANKQVAVPLDHMTLNHGKLLLPGVGEQDLLAMPAVPADGGMYRSLRATELVSVRSSAASPTGTGNIRRQP